MEAFVKISPANQILTAINAMEPITIEMEWEHGQATFEKDFFEIVETNQGEFSLTGKIAIYATKRVDPETRWEPEYIEQYHEMELTELALREHYNDIIPMSPQEEKKIREAISSKIEII